MTKWIKHDGKSCPVGLDTKVYVKWGDGSTDELHADGSRSPPYTALEWGGNHSTANWFWHRDQPSAVEIAEYRVVSP